MHRRRDEPVTSVTKLAEWPKAALWGLFVLAMMAFGSAVGSLSEYLWQRSG
jgi:hypothetical protein